MTNSIKISKYIIKIIFILLILTGVISSYLNIFYYPNNLNKTSLMQKNTYFLKLLVIMLRKMVDLKRDILVF